MPRDATVIKDPARLLALLWTGASATGRTGLTVAAIVNAAVERADAEGIAAVAMRHVAEQLGVGTMTIYTHVPGKPELVELMLDRVASETYADGRTPALAGPWQDGVRRVADANWDLHRRHPWTVDVVPGRPVLGPGITGKYEAELAPFDGIGLDDVEIDRVLSAVLGQTESAARWLAGLTRVRTATGTSDEEWWETVGPAMAQAMAGRSYPLAARIGSASSQASRSAGDPRAVLDAGIELLIAGLEQRLP
jgi:AcrR family transcriptional regulator